MAQLSPSAAQIELLAGKTNDNLLEDLGYALFEKEAGRALSRPPKLTQLRARAEDWLAAQSEMIKTEICNSKSLRSLVESEPTSREKIITVIFDVLSAHFSGFPVATIAEILFREGIARTCAARWSNDRK